MKALGSLGRKAFLTLLCLSLAVWSAVPTAAHASAVFETLHAHSDIGDHGHSHGPEEDLYERLHGHSHDTADHDHSPAMLVRGSGPGPLILRDLLRIRPVTSGPLRQFRIDRPPRA
ncbi:MAG: hypothetical protein AAGL24_20480 [Pseudomonadota bacterium]